MFFRRRRRAIETADARTVVPFGFGAMSKRMSSTRGERDDAPRSSVTFETETETETDDDDDDGSLHAVVPRSPRSPTPRGDIEETSRRPVPARRDAAREREGDRERTRPMNLAPEDALFTHPPTV